MLRLTVKKTGVRQLIPSVTYRTHHLLNYNDTRLCYSNQCNRSLSPLKQNKKACPIIFRSTQRTFCDKPLTGAGKGHDKKSKKDKESTSEIVLTPGQKVVAGTRLTIIVGVATLAITCAYYIIKELLPSKMSPNSIFDGAFAKMKENEDIKRRYGTSLKAYGRDHGGHREGRRNFIEHSAYKDKDDGSNRTRVRFNLQGQHGNAFVFAEVSSDMKSGEFVYLMVQDARNGQVTTLIDNRSALMVKRMAGGSEKGQEAFANLLRGKK